MSQDGEFSLSIGCSTDQWTWWPQPASCKHMCHRDLTKEKLDPAGQTRHHSAKTGQSIEPPTGNGGIIMYGKGTYCMSKTSISNDSLSLDYYLDCKRFPIKHMLINLMCEQKGKLSFGK